MLAFTVVGIRLQGIAVKTGHVVGGIDKFIVGATPRGCPLRAYDE